MGAPKGNTNALKHGLYAKRYSPEETAGLRKMQPEDLFLWKSMVSLLSLLKE